MFIEPWKFLFASLIPLLAAGWEDAKSREVSNVWFVMIFILGLASNLELLMSGYQVPAMLAVALSLLVAVAVKFKPDFLPKGDSRLIYSLAFLYGTNLLFIMGLTILFTLVWNTVKRRPFNTPLPLAPFLFVSAALVNAFILINLLA